MGAVIAKNIKLFNLRKSRGWTQKQAADKLRIPINVYARIEQGVTPGKVDVWSKIQMLYEIPDKDMWNLIKGK